MNVFKMCGSILCAACLSLMPTTASAMGVSASAGGSFSGLDSSSVGAQVEVVPYIKPIPLLSAELGYRLNAHPAIGHSVVPGLNVGVPAIGRLRIGVPIGLNSELPVSLLVGIQKDIVPLPLAKLFYEVDLETDFGFNSRSLVIRMGGRFGL